MFQIIPANTLIRGNRKQQLPPAQPWRVCVRIPSGTVKGQAQGNLNHYRIKVAQIEVTLPTESPGLLGPCAEGARAGGYLGDSEALPDWLLQELVQHGAISPQWVIRDHEEVSHKGEGQQAGQGQRMHGHKGAPAHLPDS